MKRISLIILIILFLVGCSPKESLTEIPKEQLIEHVLPQQGTAILYFGRDSCPHCKKFFPKLKKVMKKQGKVLYYYNIDTHREDSLLPKEMKKFQVEEIPLLIIYKNKTITATLMGDKSEKEIENFINQAT